MLRWGMSSPRLSTSLARLVRLVDPTALLDLVVPLECAGCRRPGRGWCGRCDRALTGVALLDPAAGHAHGAMGMPLVRAWGEYAEPLRSAITAWKDEGRRDLGPLLGGLLVSAVVDVQAAARWQRLPCLVVPVPSSRRSVRQRGDAPLETLTRQAFGGGPSQNRPPAGSFRVATALTHGRRVLDQARLDTASRWSNLAGSMTVATEWAGVVRSRRCIVVDDVITTGSTIAEATRALREAGAQDVVAATVAATRRRA